MTETSGDSYRTGVITQLLTRETSNEIPVELQLELQQILDSVDIEPSTS